MPMSYNNDPVYHSTDYLSACANADSLRQSLEQAGFQVQKGDFAPVDFFKLYQEKLVRSCNGNNADNPYFACAMPLSPGQTCPDYLEIENDPPRYLSFRLRPNEAIVLVGKTPPEVKYFSYFAFLSTRSPDYVGHPQLNSPIPIELMKTKPVVKPQFIPDKDDPSIARREMIFAGLGDTLNRLSLSTPGTPGASAGNPFEQPVVLIFTASREVNEMARASALAAGYPDSAINTGIIPVDFVKLGVDEGDDTFSIGHRISRNPTDEAAFEQYIKNPGLSVFRITGPLNPAARYFPVPKLTPRGDGRTELSFWNPLHSLRRAILDKYQAEYIPVELQTNIWLNESYEAIQQNLDNLGESRDTTYLGTDNFILPRDAFAIAFGVNHARTGKCSYSNIVVYGKQWDNGVVSIADEEFAGSATDFIDGAASEYLYAWKFTYDCSQYGQPHCTVIPIGPTPALLPPYYVEADDYIYFGFRAYLEPTTKVGPAWHELLFDRVIVFVPKAKQ
jgi:hypothetical protein